MASEIFHFKDNSIIELFVLFLFFLPFFWGGGLFVFVVRDFILWKRGVVLFLSSSFGLGTLTFHYAFGTVKVQCRSCLEKNSLRL